MCGLVLTACVRQNVTHAITRNDHTHTTEREYMSVPPQPSRYTSSEGAWGVNMQERRGVERGVLGFHSMMTQFAGLEVNVRTGINHT